MKLSIQFNILEKKKREWYLMVEHASNGVHKRRARSRLCVGRIRSAREHGGQAGHFTRALAVHGFQHGRMKRRGEKERRRGRLATGGRRTRVVVHRRRRTARRRALGQQWRAGRARIIVTTIRRHRACFRRRAVSALLPVDPQIQRKGRSRRPIRRHSCAEERKGNLSNKYSLGHMQNEGLP